VGELDIASTPALERELLIVEGSDAQRIVLDLTGLSFMDGSGVHLLVRAHARSRANGGRFGVIKGSRAVHVPLRVSGVESQLPFLASDDGDGSLAGAEA